MAEAAAVPGSPLADGEVIDLLRALVATPSVNPSIEDGGSGEGAIAQLTAGWLGAWGFTVELVEAAPDRPSVLARLRRGDGPSLILNGHLDTVGVEGMTTPPFAAEVRDGRLHGRGACDMKGGVAALLAAARNAAIGDFAGELIVALTADEEEAGIGCRRLVDDGLKADAAIVCEPTGLAIMPAHKGFAWVAVDFHGRAAHGSRPDRGVDAIRHAGQFLARLEELEGTLTERRRHPLLGHGSIHAGTIHGGTAPSVYPSACRLVLERRTLPGETAAAARSEVEYLLGRLRSDAPSLRADLEVTLHRSGSEIPADHPLVTGLTGSLEASGVDARIEGMTAWVEAVVFNETGTPALCFGPGRIEDAHATDESVEIAQVEVAHRVLTTFARDFLA
ncbi:MAG: ArgE/DapE family deacylase [Gemmatimonadetes bacterium]|nr:ArgE/DapE family deacylase [Gemmatimonadota bacterium]